MFRVQVFLCGFIKAYILRVVDPEYKPQCPFDWVEVCNEIFSVRPIMKSDIGILASIGTIRDETATAL